jgi:hypothetical protein
VTANAFKEARVAKKKLLDDIVRNPARFYRVPGDVLRDRRFGDNERLEILRAWRAMLDSDDVETSQVIGELEQRLIAHAAE